MQERLQEWELFRLDPAGYRWVQQFEARPDQEQIDDALASSTDGLRRNWVRWIASLTICVVDPQQLHF